MNNLIAIVAGEPNSINSEIIAKAWKKKKRKKNIFIIGNYNILKKQIIKLGIKIPISKIEKIEDFKREERLFILDVPLKSKSIFNFTSSMTKDYIFDSFDLAHDLAINNKILGFINAPIDKKIFNNAYLGVTEYLAQKCNCETKEVMFIHNKNLSVVPLTTHIDIKNVTKKINFDLIKKKLITLNKFYFKLFEKKPKIAILGLNPHNSEDKIQSIENKIIKPSIIKLKKLKININGPFPADTAFNKNNLNNYNVVVKTPNYFKYKDNYPEVLKQLNHKNTMWKEFNGRSPEFTDIVQASEIDRKMCAAFPMVPVIDFEKKHIVHCSKKFANNSELSKTFELTKENIDKMMNFRLFKYENYCKTCTEFVPPKGHFPFRKYARILNA